MTTTDTNQSEDRDGVYHCIIDSVTTRSREEMQAHLDKMHPGHTTTDDPDDFFYPEGESYRAYCVEGARGRRPGCGWEAFFWSEESAESIAKSHSKNSHEAKVAPF